MYTEASSGEFFKTIASWFTQEKQIPTSRDLLERHGNAQFKILHFVAKQLFPLFGVILCRLTNDYRRCLYNPLYLHFFNHVSWLI